MRNVADREGREGVFLCLKEVPGVYFQNASILPSIRSPATIP